MESNRISRQLKDYLEYKHSLGFKLTHEATVLKRVIRQIKRCLFRQIKTGLSEHLTMG